MSCATAALALLLLALPAEAEEPLRLSYSQALIEAVKASPRLKQFRSRLEEARYRVDEAYTPAYPTLDFSAGYTRISPPLSFGSGERTVAITVPDNYRLAVTLRQALHTFGRLRWGALAAELSRRSAREEYRRELEGLLEEAASAYLRALLAAEEELIARDLLEARKAHLEDAEKLFRSGLVARFDVLRDRSEVSRARQQLLEAENRRRLAEARLLTLLGKPPGRSLELAPVTVEEAPPETPQEGLQRALQRRPELTALEWALQAAQARIRLAESQDSPRLDLQSEASQRNTTGFASGQLWSTSVQLSIPLFDGGLSEARADQARAAAEELRARLEEARRQVALEVQSAYLELVDRWEQIRVSEDHLEEAEEALRVARVRYRNGVSTNLELLDAEAARNAARLARAAARYGYLEARVRWRRVISAEPPVEIPAALQLPREEVP